MLKNLKKISGVEAISKKQQLSINGGDDNQPFNNPTYFNCLRTCGGSCSGSGQCFWMIK